MEKVFGRSTHNGVIGKNHDAGVILSYSKLILSANHPERLHPADFRLLYFEITGKNRPDAGKKNLLASRHIRSAANHGNRIPASVIHFCDMEMVGIRMWHALQDFSHDNTGESAGNLLLFLH